MSDARPIASGRTADRRRRRRRRPRAGRGPRRRRRRHHRARRSRPTPSARPTSCRAQAGVVAGLPVVALRVRRRSARAGCASSSARADGAPRRRRARCWRRSRGPVRDLLTAERTALNLLGHLSGRRHAHPALGRRRRRHRRADPRHPQDDARACARWRSTRCAAAAASTTACRCRTPRWSRTTTWPPPAASSQAFDAGARGATRTCRSRSRSTPSSRRARSIDAGADLVLLDNMTPGRRCAAVALWTRPGARLEASGGLHARATPRAVAATGVDYLSVGALTHSAPVLDIGLDICDLKGRMLLAIDIGNTNTVLGRVRRRAARPTRGGSRPTRAAPPTSWR